MRSSAEPRTSQVGTARTPQKQTRTWGQFSRKVRYRGIVKNGAQVFSLLALANLYLARRFHAAPFYPRACIRILCR